MRDRHVPDLEFVERLEAHIGAGVRRRNRYADVPRWARWLAQSPLKAAVAAALLMLISMGIGGIVVAAAYQSQNKEQRDALKAQYSQRLALATQAVDIAAKQLELAKRQASVGIETQEALLDAQLKFAAAEAQVKTITLDIAEIDVTGHEPLHRISAPLVSGRDFVTDRWQIEMTVPVAALDLEKSRLHLLEVKFNVGMATNLDVASSQTHLADLEASVSAFQKRLSIRKRFLNREFDAGLADLYVLETDAEQRHQTVARQIDLAQKLLKDMMIKAEIGTLERIDVSRAQLHVKELELDLTKADVDLAAIRKQIEQRRAGK